jgi:hypothetical protein
MEMRSNKLGWVFAGWLLLLSSPLVAQTPDVQPQQTAAASGLHDWTDDGTRDRLLSASEKFFGNVAQFYISLPREEAGRELTANQFAFAFHGYPEPEAELAGGRRLFVGADPESLAEKALVVTEADRTTVRAIAMLHQSCGGMKRFDRVTKKWTTCPRLPALTFFVHADGELDADVKSDVVRWTKAFAVRNNREVDKLSLNREGSRIRAIRIEVRRLPSD